MTEQLDHCPFCGGEIRWCGEGEKACGNEHCDHLHCDSSGMHFSLESEESASAKTFDEMRLLVAKAWNTRYDGWQPIETARYFVSYSHEKGFGCCEILHTGLITNYSSIKEIITLLEEGYNLKNVIIISFRLFDE